MLILIEYNRDRFQGPSISSRQLFFLLALRGRTERVWHILRRFKQVPDFQDLLEILNEPYFAGVFLSQMISQLKMFLLLLLTILATDKLFNANLRIIQDHGPEEVLLLLLLGLIIWDDFYCLADSATGSYGVSHMLERSMVHDGL